ncbi:MAG TPA: hypothetical protein VFJ84_03360 [Candidatus Saccharimonadales bacterium]|nr:hypothetical protein [Candidatus Saccharimonadales bacterium]
MSEDNTNWSYSPDGSEKASPPAGGQGAVSWEASEYIEHHHGPAWYLLLCLITAALAAAVYYLSSRDAFAGGLIIALGIIVGVFAGHKPGVIRYEITDGGLKVKDRLFRYQDYKSFAVINEGRLSSLNLLPLKRFMPPVSAYFDPADEKKIVEAIGDNLPYEPRKLDAVERLARRLRL